MNAGHLRAVLILLVTGGLVTISLVARRGSEPAEPVTGSSPRITQPQMCFAYADPDGADSGNGHAARPFRSVQALLRALPAGRVGCLRAGTYTGDVTMLRPGTTLRSAPGERAALHLGALDIPADVPDTTVSHLDIVGTGGDPTVRAVGDGFTLERNDVTNHHSGASCVMVGASDHRTVDGTIRANVIHGCGRIGDHLHHGIYAQNVGTAAEGRLGAGLLIEQNVIYDVASYAVQLYPQASAVLVRRNVIDGGGASIRGGIVIDGPDSWGNTIEQNVIGRTRTGAVVQRTGTGHVSRDNCLWGNARDVVGPGITSLQDRDSPECWLADDLWARTGQQAADEPTTSGARRATSCETGRAGALCRRLTRR